MIIEMEILPKTEWDLRRISIRTFTQCIAGMTEVDSAVTYLEQAGWRTMADISPWFMISEEFMGKEISPIEKSILTNQLPNSEEIRQLTVCRRVWGTNEIGGERLDAIKRMVSTGVHNILYSSRRGRFLPIEWRMEEYWRNKLFMRIRKGGYKGGTLCSDASKLTNTSCAVVGEDMELVEASTIGGRQTSHRGEGFGILIAA